MNSATEFTKPRRRREASDASAIPVAAGAERLELSHVSAAPVADGREEPVQTSDAHENTFRVATPYVLEAKDLHKTYRKGKHTVPVLKGCDFRAVAGKMTAILGQSGSGKSTLLHLLGTLDAPDSGEIYFDGRRIDSLSRRQRDRFRNSQLGMIFQFYHLLPEVTALQNVLLPMMIQQGVFKYLSNRQEVKEKAIHLLDRVGLSHRMHHKPRELSGGEMQRAAIARALVSDPELILADEPTGNLDRETGLQILSLLHELNRESGITIVMVTHDESIAEQCHSTIRLADGQICES